MRDQTTGSLSLIPKDVAKLIALQAGSLFSLSSIDRKFRSFFQQEREAVLKRVKIFVNEEGTSSYLLTYDGKLYACGENKKEGLGLNGRSEQTQGEKNYRQWTQIAPKGVDENKLNKYLQKVAVSETLMPVLDLGLPREPMLSELIEEVVLLPAFAHADVISVTLKGVSKTVRVIKRVESRKHVFACGEDGWYFAGDNALGQNGMNDARFFRRKWIKVLSHGESIEEALQNSPYNTENINKASLSSRFRNRLKKIFDTKRIRQIETMQEFLPCGTLSLRYYSEAEEKYCFHFLLANQDFFMLTETEREFVRSQLASISKFPIVTLLPGHHLDKNESRQCVPLIDGNYREIQGFIKNYEKMLDAYEQEVSNDGEELRLNP